MAEWLEGSHSIKRHMTVHLDFAKRHLNDDNVRKKILWSDETKFALCLTNTIPMVKHDGSSFSEAGTGELVRIERRMNATKYRELLEENLLQSARNLRLGRRFTFHTQGKTMLEWLQDKSLTILHLSSQSPDLYPIEHL